MAKPQQTRLNHAIRASELRVIDQNGNQMGVISKGEALRHAELAGLDLVEVSPNANPPVARIVDWGKYKYEKTKQLKQQRKQQKVVDIKQIRLGMRIGDNDLEIKLNKARKFLEAGHKVKLMLLYRGRENAHRELGFVLFDRITQKIEDIAIVDQPAQLNGRNLTITYKKSSSTKTPKDPLVRKEPSPPSIRMNVESKDNN